MFVCHSECVEFMKTPCSVVRCPPPSVSSIAECTLGNDDYPPPLHILVYAPSSSPSGLFEPSVCAR